MLFRSEESGTVQAAHPGCFLFCSAFCACHPFLVCMEAVLQPADGDGVLAAGPYDAPGLLSVLGLFASPDLWGMESGVPAGLPYRLFPGAGACDGGSADLVPDYPADEACDPSGTSAFDAAGSDGGASCLGRCLYRTLSAHLSAAARAPGVWRPAGGGAHEKDQHARRPLRDWGDGAYLRGNGAD